MTFGRSHAAAPALAFSLLMGLVACSSTPLKAAGSACSADSQCAAGLSCLAIGAFSDAGCTPAASACSKACALDSDCAPLGARFKCFAACDGTRSCGETP